MAISFSRPDPSSPAAVGAAQFTVGRRGFEQEEVRDFLRMVSAELARLQERERFLESELRALQTRGMSAPGVLDEETVTALLGSETARVLTVAREAAQQMRIRAAESAERLVREASADASRMREEAEIESSRRRTDATADVEVEIEFAKQQGRDMVNEAREYREKVIAEMARRREVARLQIEQLIHDRDQLLGVFERASVVANDVVEDLKEFDSISEAIAQAANPSSAPFDYEKDPTALTSSVVSTTTTSDTEATEITTEVGEALEGADVLTTEAIGAETVMAENVVDTSSVPDTSSMAAHPSSEPVGVEHIAEVVQLFGKSKKERILEVVTARVPVPEVGTEHPTPKAPSTKTQKKSVDDLFAKLRSTNTSTVADQTRALSKKSVPKKVEVLKTPVKSPATPTAPKAVTPQTDGSHFVRRNDMLAPLMIAMTRKMKRILADEENSILNYLVSKKAVVALEKVLPEFTVHTQQYVEALSEEIMSAAIGGAKSLSGGMKADLRKKITNAAVMQVLVKNIDDNIIRPLRERIQRCVEQSDGSCDEMSNLVRSAYREWKMQRVDAVIPDLACLAYSRGAYLVLDSGAPACWMVDPNGPPCADAEDNALAGATPLGTEFPTGHVHPIAHASCRCLVTPVLR